MSSISIEPVATKRQQNEFIDFAWTLYREDPLWIPPLRQNLKELVNFAHHPFYTRNKVQCFLARRDGKVVGRIAAILNVGHIERYDEKRGFWGFFESVDDTEVSGALFDAVKAWFAEQGIHKMRGPANPSLNHEVGTLVEGFDSSPAFMMTYNPPYYEKLILDYGYEKTQDLYAFWGHLNMLEGLDPKLQFIVDEAKKRFNLKLRRMDRRRFKEDVYTFLDIYNRSLVGTWGFVPIDKSEVDKMAADLKHLLVPELTSVCEVDGEVIGSMFGMLDYNPRIKQIDGRLFPFGFFRLLWNKKAIKNMRLISTNVVPEYQRWGIGLVILERLVADLRAWGVEEVEFSWVLESNHLSRASLERGGAKRSKTYRMYDYAPAEKEGTTP
ncbi:GNAT family N-acetyltransferase [Bremerella cremea]|uniref:N-acetyltransferase n=1 Tax=Blastopirellula marina TaxID=124 RepID=A0A2S8FJD0_9BACT|nr:MULTISPECIES: GNAT family N-acetyltransferase [Pirellulaceae]PQO32295.1 N-acetyltransferase [Blastopirellula marina]RCS45362.1 GNAT family N-acetyltransferase [Bremerella cremea]